MELNYWANHNDLTGDHYGCCRYYYLGTFRQTSFIHSFFETDNFHYSIDYSGTVTAVVISLSEEPQFFVDDQGSFFFSQILDLKII